MGTVKISTTSIALLRISIGVIYLWFGVLKFFHGQSPAEDLAINTINGLTLNVIPMPTNLLLLAIWESLIGVFMIIGFKKKFTLIIFFIHMACTFAPLFFFPQLSFKTIPYGFTLVGQYIMKNIIIICAGFIIWQSIKINSQRS